MITLLRLWWLLTGNCKRYIPDTDGICRVCRIRTERTHKKLAGKDVFK